MSLFNRAVESSTEPDFGINRDGLHALSVHLSRYFDQYWWKYKQHIVRAWTNQCKHFGIRDTSFVEGTHAKCKNWLRGCHGDLFTVCNCLTPWWNTAAFSTRLLVQRNSVRVPCLSNEGTTMSVLNPVSTLPVTNVQDPSVFHTSIEPPRFWGYARWS
eukprot:jgi/Phyca11/105345/e_gw1.10.794.1